jgi:hypothetical protein
MEKGGGNSMKTKALSILSVAALVLALGSVSKADTWTLAPGLSADGSLTAAGGNYSVTLTFNNTTGSAAGVDWFDLQLFDPATGMTVDSATIGGANFGTGNTWESFGGQKGNNGANDCTSQSHPGWVCADGGSSIFATIGANSSLTFVITGTYVGTPTNPIEHMQSSGCTVVTNNGTTCNANGAGSWNISAGPDGTPTGVPEPGTLALFGTGVLSIAGALRRKLFA